MTLCCRSITPIFSEAGTTFTDNPITTGLRSAAHGLGALPTMVIAHMECKTAQYGYAVGDTLYVASHGIAGGMHGGSDEGLVIGANATLVFYRVPAGTFEIVRFDTGAVASITLANWIMEIHSYL